MLCWSCVMILLFLLMISAFFTSYFLPRFGFLGSAASATTCLGRSAAGHDTRVLLGSAALELGQEERDLCRREEGSNPICLFCLVQEWVIKSHKINWWVAWNSFINVRRGNHAPCERQIPGVLGVPGAGEYLFAEPLDFHVDLCWEGSGKLFLGGVVGWGRSRFDVNLNRKKKFIFPHPLQTSGMMPLKQMTG